MSGLWKNDPKTSEGKYPIVLRRDGSVLEGPYFVIAYRDPCAAAAFAAYADEAEQFGWDPKYVEDMRAASVQAEQEAIDKEGIADPTAPPSPYRRPGNYRLGSGRSRAGEGKQLRWATRHRERR